ncbi:SDR family NAD(P)-dependent oxidoreductase [Streptomyces diastatochromogenes]|uniref:Short-chain dehydrogenase n=1 Tax=Streptomyces diastatochromogenes TaxID=42236 RepID=A0A233S9I2_STRDA|nr:SDR family NAD(P)-dependent oxidoreductase [Streptomyces diastatochromogenes]MCZ0991049.1 SDR family NAD(P)-dependent oxidoreductase [Streptomyces diastatochromogenes]OXY92291.1 hypothetical protein BEK98_26235 [Streptomyces diastatochromogenes]
MKTTASPGGPIVLVTGAGSGIGHAIATRLVSDGYRVLGGAIDDQEAAALLQAFPAGLTPLVFDVRDEDNVQAAAKVTRDAFGEARLAGVLNIAGVITNGPLVDLTADAFLKVLSVNLIGIHNVTRAFLPLIAKGGKVVNMSSASGTRTLPFTGAYSASKFGVEALSTAMRMEFAPLGIHVSVVAPGLINTPMAGHIQDELRKVPSLAVYAAPLGRFLDRTVQSAAHGIAIERVVDKVVKALTAERPAPRYDIPHSYLQDVVLMRMLPIRVREALVRRVLGLVAS